MTENAQDPALPSAKMRPADKVAPEATRANAADAKAPPSLSTYFGDKKIRAAAFAKAVNIAGLKYFEEADRTSALDLMYKNDPDGKRLWALISLGRAPDPINSWMWLAAKDRLSRVLGSEVDIATQAPGQLIDLLRKRFPALSSTKDKAGKTEFLFSVRVAATWLLSKRRIPTWEVIEFCSALLFSDERNAGQLVTTSVRAGSAKDLNLAASVGFLGRRRIAEIGSEVDRVKGDAANMQHRLDQKVTENSELQAALDDLRQHNAHLLQGLTDLRTQFETARQHSGYDLTELKAGNSMLLRDRIAPLIRDAIDALEIDTPAPEVAVRRLKRAVSTIEEALK